MTLMQLKNRRLPWYENMFADLLGTERLLTNDLLLETKTIPAMNIKENKENFEIDIAAPGFSKKDLKIVIDNGMLSISAVKKEEKEEKEEDYMRREFNYNSFSRRFTLPENVNEDEKIRAVYKDGILKLVLGKLDKKEIPRKRVIQIS